MAVAAGKTLLPQQAFTSPILPTESVWLCCLQPVLGLTIPMMQIQINIKDTVKFLAQPQDPQDSIIQVTEARSFISVKTMSVRLKISNAIASDLCVVIFAWQVSTPQGQREAWPRPRSDQGTGQ